MNNNNIYILGNSGKLMKFEAHKLPEIKEAKNKNYAIYGTDKDWRNRQPQYYNWLYNSSSKHNAIVNTKNRFIIGNGLEVDYTGLDTERKLDSAKFVNKVNGERLLNKISLDRIIQGGFSVEMIPSEDSEHITPYHIEFANIRVSKTEYEKDGTLKPTKYYYTDNWKTSNPENNEDFVVFEQFTFDLEKLDKDKRYLFYYKDYNPDERIYPLPEYAGGVPYVSADVEVGNFVYNNVAHGFTAGLLVNFYNGDPTPEQKADIEKRWDLRNHGSKNAGKPIIAFNELDSAGVDVTPLNANGQDDRYTQLNDQIRDEIFTAHETDPILVFGMTGEGGFSNDAQEKRVAFEYFKVSYVEPNQATFEMFFNAVLAFNDETFRVKIKPLNQIKPELSEATLVQISTAEELRSMAGLEQLDLPSNKVAESLATLSPLLATKVLETMSAEEIRSLVGLTGGSAKTTVTEAKQFNQENEWQFFDGCGISDDTCTEIDSQEIPLFSIEDAKEKQNKFASQFATRKEIGVLSLLKEGMTPKEIQDAVKIDEAEFEEVVETLGNEGLYEDGAVTPQGETAIQTEIPFVVYKYVTRPDAPALITESRPFCKNMLRLSKTISWTIEDIERISAQQGRDVFATRGGWYTNPDTGVHTPFCRHYWQQRLVRRNG